MHTFLARRARFVADAYVQGQLYDIGSYPGLIESSISGELVAGELYDVHNDEELLARLDDYEQCSAEYPEPWEYQRKKLSVRRDDGQWVDAWVYVYNWPVEHLPRIG